MRIGSTATDSMKVRKNRCATDVDYAQLVKIYGPAQSQSPERKYSPGNFCGTKVSVVSGDPDEKNISTSYVERQNLTMRMSMRRFTRLTNGFSKKIENHMHAIALHFMHYNFARIHKTLRITPAMAAGTSHHICRWKKSPPWQTETLPRAFAP